MNLKRILKLAMTSFFGQGISVITQLLIPPLFLRCYTEGLAVYGEWIALSASINYLGTLNYGIQTYANNQMSILYNRGEISEAKAIQASALRLFLILVISLLIGGVAVFFIPVAGWLRLKHVTPGQASMTLYLLLLQMALMMVFSMLTNSYMAIGELHRGNYWSDGQRLFNVLVLSVALARQASFPVLATIQLINLVLFFLLVAVDLRRRAPLLLPSLRYGSWRTTRDILLPSGHFGLIAFAGFLTWQGPVILIQRMLGASAVGEFALVRVVFQMSRQILSVASGMISQDITMLVGQGNWVTLRRLYDLSERVVLFLIPIVSIGSLLMCPFLFTVWLHKRSVYTPLLCILMAITSAVLGIKEHKTQFQSSSNEHEELSRVIVPGYIAMLVVSVFAMKMFGLVGFMVTWVTWEIIQTAYVVQLNKKLFPEEVPISTHPLRRLVLFLIPAFSFAAWPAYAERSVSLVSVVGISLATCAVMAAAAYVVFGMNEIKAVVESRVRRRRSGASA